MERRQESRISKLREESRRRPRQRGGVRRRRGPSPKSLAILPQRLKACNNILSRSMSSIYRRVIFGAVDMLSIHLFCYYSLNDTVFSHTVCIICSSFSTAPRTTLLSKSIRKWGGGGFCNPHDPVSIIPASVVFCNSLCWKLRNPSCDLTTEITFVVGLEQLEVFIS